MPDYSTGDIRNIAVVGHSGSGKTSLCEAFLFATGATNRLGSTADKTSHLDVDDEEKERGYSIDAHVLHVSHNNAEINLIDTPGAPDFIGPAVSSLAAVETAMIVIHAVGGVQVNTRRMREQAKNNGLARVLVVNRIDADNVDLPALVDNLRESFGSAVTPVNLPTGGGSAVVDCIAQDGGDADFSSVAETHTNIVERVAEADDALMTRYFDEGTLSVEEINANIIQAIAAGTLVPILFTNAVKNVGTTELLDFLAKCCPSPLSGKQRTLLVGDVEKPFKPDADPFCGQVFKVAVDHKSHMRYSFIRVFSGSLKSDDSLILSGQKKGARPGHLLKFQGAEHKDIDTAIAGDIFAVAKQELHIGDTVFSEPCEGRIAMVKTPMPMFSLA